MHINVWSENSRQPVTRARLEQIQVKILGGDLDVNRDRTSKLGSFVLFLALHLFPTARDFDYAVPIKMSGPLALHSP